MKEVVLHLSEDEALALYRHLHLQPSAQESYWETYRQLQSHFFQRLTVDELTRLLEEGP